MRPCKPILPLLLLLAFNFFSFAQSRQKGTAYRYNGKNPRTVLPGVLIQCEDASNNNIVTGADGAFTLSLPSLKAGDPLHHVKVSKKGMVVMNQETVREWSVRKEPLVVVLRDEEEIRKETRQMEEAAQAAANRIYETKKSELERELREGFISKKERAERLAALQDAVEAFRKQSRSYASFLVGIDLHEVSLPIQEAIKLVTEGKPEAASFLLEEERFPERFGEGTVDDNTVLGSRVLLAIYRLCLDWKKYESLLQKLEAMTDKAEVQIEYGSHLIEKGDLSAGIERLEKALDRLDKTGKPQWYISAQNWLANAQSAAGNMEGAIRICESALSFMDTLEEGTCEEGFLDVSRASFLVIQTDALYSSGMDNDDIARQSITAARRAARSDYGSDGTSLLIAAYSSRLISLYNQGRKKEAKAISKELETLLAQSPETFSISATALTARMLPGAGDLEKSVQLLRENIDLCWKYAKGTPWKYEPLAATYEEMLALYILATDSSKARIPEVEELLDESVDILRRYSEIHPDLHANNLAKVLFSRSSYFRRVGKVDEAVLSDARSAVDISRSFADREPGQYGHQLARHLDNYASCLDKTVDPKAPAKDIVREILQVRREAVSIMRQLPNPADLQKQDLIAMLINLATSERGYLGNTRETRKLLNEAETLAEDLAKTNPAVYGAFPETLKKMKLLFALSPKGKVKLED